MTRVSLQLSCLSSFARSLQCNGKSIAAFQSRWETVSQQSVTQWRQAIVCAVVDNHWPSTAVSSRRTSNSASQHPHPSPSLITALLSLSTSVQQIGMPAALAKREQWSTNVLTDFISTSLEVLDPAGSDGRERAQQILWDLSFLGAMIRSWGETMQTSSNQLDALAAKLEKKLPNPDVNNTHISMDETLSRHRMLLAALLPASLTSNSTTTISGKATTSPKFVRSGTTESQYQPAIELVKPPPRFGLLLVGSTTAR
ncbi:hypothetical protein QCA50_002465 [Cerrena zonata]|uniref:Uncharacterized protein n=1 Tax=Cerrena zonata TaxID=2478898 RepID=A0AAW0GZ08_9APHY